MEEDGYTIWYDSHYYKGMEIDAEIDLVFLQSLFGEGTQELAEVYENQDLGFRLLFPADWKDAYQIEINPGSSFGVLIATSWGGTLATLLRTDAGEWDTDVAQNMIPVAYHVLHEGDDYVYVLYFASDVNYDLNDPEQTRNYKDMRQDLYHVGFELIPVVAADHAAIKTAIDAYAAGFVGKNGELLIDSVVQCGTRVYAAARHDRIEGQGNVHLFVLENQDGNWMVNGNAYGDIPQSMGMDLYRVDVATETILFGMVTDQLWFDLDGAPEKMDFSGVTVVYSGGKEKTVEVGNHQAFLICMENNAQIEDVLFLSNGKPAGRLSELPLTDPVERLNQYGNFWGWKTTGVETTGAEDPVARYQELLGQDYWYTAALGAIYDTPAEMDLKLIFYNRPTVGDNWTTLDAGETAFLLEAGFLRESAVQKRPATELDAILRQYFGVTLDECEIPRSWVYYPATDCYYSNRNDAYLAHGVVVTRVEEEGDLVRLFYEAGPNWAAFDPDTGLMVTHGVLTLERAGDSYLVRANQSRSS